MESAWRNRSGSEPEDLEQWNGPDMHRRCMRTDEAEIDVGQKSAARRQPEPNRGSKSGNAPAVTEQHEIPSFDSESS